MGRFSILTIASIIGITVIPICNIQRKGINNTIFPQLTRSNNVLRNDSRDISEIIKNKIDQTNRETTGNNSSNSSGDIETSDNARKKLIGKYIYKPKTVGDNPDIYASIFDVFFELNEKDTAVFTKKKGKLTILKAEGAWSWNNTEKVLTAIFPSVKRFANREEYISVTVKFKPVGKNLKVIYISPSEAGNVDAMFVRR